MVDLVNLQEDGLHDVVSNELEPGVPEMVKQVLLPAGEEIINDDDAVTSLNQTVHQVAPHKPGPTGDQDPLALTLQPPRHAHLPFLQQDPPSRESQLGSLRDGCSSGRRLREGVEEESGNDDTDEEEGDSPSKHVQNWVCGISRRIGRGRCTRDGLFCFGSMDSVNQLGRHICICSLFLFLIHTVKSITFFRFRKRGEFSLLRGQEFDEAFN